MDLSDTDRIKHRQIPFSALHPIGNQAQQAALLLADAEGVLRAEPVSPRMLHVSYDLLQTTLEHIEGMLREHGLHLDNSLVYRLKRALYHYTEETQRANCGCPHGQSNCTRTIFANRYQSLDHGCRDHRPEHWRRYL